MNKAIIVKADDWEGLFVNEKLVYEHHEIDRKTLRKLCKEYGLDYAEIEEVWVTEEYEDYLCGAGSFHENLSEVDYEPNLE